MVISIAESFVEVAKEHCGRAGMVEARSGKQVSFGEINRNADRYAQYLHSHGLKPGDITILMVKPSVDFICLSLALFKIGTPIVLIDPGMGYKNLLRCIERVEPKYLIGIPLALLFAKIFPKPFKSIEKVFCCGKSFGLFGADISTDKGGNSDPYPVYQPSKTDLAAIIFTTGSTGPPKGVRYEHSIFSAQLRLIKDYYSIGPNDVDQPAFPLFALFSAALGACAVIPDMNPTQPAKVNPKKFVDSILKYQVTYSFGSPAIWNVVSNYCLQQGIVLHSVKKILMAGAPVPYDLMARVQQILPRDAQVFTPYGATESLPIVSIEAKEVVSETWASSRVGKGTCVGRPLPGIHIRIIKISDKALEQISDVAAVKQGEIGEIIVQGDVVTKAYHNNPEETRLAKITDGQSFWHRMGDVGYLDHDNRLWFCGRRAHRVVTASGTLFSVPCEAIVNEHPLVYRSALVGVNVPGITDSVVPVLIVEPQSNNKDGGGKKRLGKINNKKLLEEVRNLAEKSEFTRTIQHFLIHEDFPVDIRHNAKIFREKLALWAQIKLSPLR